MSDQATAAFPAPDTTGIAAPYWAALKEGRMLFMRCKSCGNAWLPARGECPKCLSDQTEWEQASGKAKLISWVWYHHAYHPWFATKLPYNVAVVELAEGARLVSNIVNATASNLRIDMPLQLAIEHEGEVAVARFRVG